jgi:transketolase
VFACHHRLDNLVVLVDHNNLQGFGSTADVASMSPLWERLRGFDVDLRVLDGHDPAALRQHLPPGGDRMRIAVLKTVKGRGVSFMENRMEWHYLPLKQQQYEQAVREIEAS